MFLMDRPTFRRTNSEKQRGRIDRFVASRDAIGVMRDAQRRYSWHAGSYDQGIQNNSSFFEEIRKKKYISSLEKAFNTTFETVPQRNNPYSYLVRPWPCVPRKRSYLSSAEGVLDLPTYSYAILPDIIDWSADDILVAALGREYHMWSWTSQKNIGCGTSTLDIHCCKFDPTGELLLIGASKGVVETHDINTNVVVSRNVGIDGHDRNCIITAVDWSPTGNAFVAGCSNGSVMSYTRSAKKTNGQHLVNGPIITVRVSPNARHLAAAGFDMDHVLILTWPELKIITCVYTESRIKTMAWHPWKSSLLGVGSMTKEFEPQISMLTVPTETVVNSSLGAKWHSLEAMLFSHRTGELIISLYRYDNPFSKSHLVVMSDFDTVVDTWGEGHKGLGRVDMMVFSPDGTKLATATSFEELIIWNFLPEDSKKDAKKIKKTKRFSALPVFLDHAGCGFSLR